MNRKALFMALAATCLAATATDRTELTVRADRPGAEIKPTMYGLFFEDINFAADGGLYAEMIKNRSFEFPDPLMGWESFGEISVRNDGPFERNPHYVRLAPASHHEKATGLTNEGFFGVTFLAGKEYKFSVWARTDAKSGSGSQIRVQLIDPASRGRRSQIVTSETIGIKGHEWTRYTATLRPDATVERGRLRIFLDSPDGCDLEHISLFPADTWKGREGGLRRDLAQKLADLHPGVFRFPGGCIVEGTDLATRYQWKNTVGPVENRPLNENRWHYTFRDHFYPDYYQTSGLGFYEYFLLSEEIGAEPLPVLNVGLSCQYQNHDEHAHVPVDSLRPYIDDALDLIEFANGDTTTTWGALRAEMGHPAPFGMKFIAIGNEQWGPEYTLRLKPFIDALRKTHPEIKIVGSSGPRPDGEEFEYLWPEMTRLKADLVDEHYYADEDFFLSNATRYDAYDRRGPAVFAGEYACHGKGRGFNHFNAALMEAAFMTGLERNADIVHMATYAPLFAHAEGWQWRPDLIWFDNTRSVPTSSYYVQQLYAMNKGSRVLPTTLDGKPATGAEGQNGLYASAVVDDASGDYIVKVANTSDAEQPLKIRFDGMKKRASLAPGRVIMLHSDDPAADNVEGLTERVRPVETALPAEGHSVEVSVPAKTFAVYIIPFKK